MGYRQEVKRTFVIPAIAALCMGLVSRLLYQGLYLWTESSHLSVIISIAVGAMIYFILLLLLGGLTSEELLSFPKGRVLAGMAKKIKS